MNPYLASGLKALLTAAFILGMSELAKRSSFASALLVALPLATVLTVIWLYLDTHDAARAGHYAFSVLLLLPPGCVLLLVLPLAIRWGLDFWPSLGLAAAATALIYYAYVFVLQRAFGVTL
jgi:hypothetical protein